MIISSIYISSYVRRLDVENTPDVDVFNYVDVFHARQLTLYNRGLARKEKNDTITKKQKQNKSKKINNIKQDTTNINNSKKKKNEQTKK